MSSSSSASRSQTHTTRGIPSKYWCGSNLTTFGAQTKENLYRRFYRCEIAIKSDFQSIKRTTTMRLQEHGKKIDESLLEMKRIFHDQTILLEELRNKSTSVLDAKSHCPLLNVAAAAIALGTLAWLYAKMTSI
ncbi:BnaAnng21070D [Brassica napus]|uniref:BnaAnng21070D protein n=2 Tax=Brassica TaxID=3705 RepID=A0A078JK96_BRANA|nr:BnaAnng21070D [Brassica napus]